MHKNIAAFTAVTPAPDYVPYVSINRLDTGGVVITTRGDNSVVASVWLSEADWQTFRKRVWHDGKRP